MQTTSAMNTIFAVATLLLAPALAGTAAAQDGTGERRSISVTGQGEAAGRPDLATVSVGVQTRAATVAEAMQENQANIERMMAALGEQGIDGKDIQTSDYSIWPDQRTEVRNGDEVTRIDGYRVSNTVTVTVRDIDDTGEVLAAVTDAGANTVHGVQFGVDDTTALEERARAAAMKDAKAQAEALAELAGVALGDVLHISMSSGGGYPVPYRAARMEAMDASAPGISPGQMSVSVSVQVTYAIR